jgi:hypothetical protein
VLLRLFERFLIHVDGSEGRIEPIVRNDAWTSVAVELESGDLLPVPVLRPTGLETAENNLGAGFPPL